MSVDFIQIGSRYAFELLYSYKVFETDYFGENELVPSDNTLTKYPCCGKIL